MEMLNNINMSYTSAWQSMGLQEKLAELPSFQSLLRGRTAIMVAALFFTSQSTGSLSSHVNPLMVPQSIEDKSQDLAFFEVAEHFEKNIPRIKKAEANDLALLLLQLSKRYKISPTLLLSLIETESSYRVKAVSRVGALGLMQVRPSTAKEVAKKYRIQGYKSKNDLFNPKINMRIGVAYLNYLRNVFTESSQYLTAYNMGPTALSRILASGNYEGVSRHSYADKIQMRTLKMRDRAAILTAAAF